MQPESMEPHQSIQSRQLSNQTDTSLVRSSYFPLQNSAGFVAQQQSVAGKGNSQGGRRRGDFSKPSLRGPPQKYSRSKKDGKPKGQAAPGSCVQVYHEVAQDPEIELELSLARGRKVSLNHLLNFTFQSRGDQMPSRGRNRFLSQSSYHYIKPAKYNKDQFLQANCQFIVKHEADYSVYLADPDLLVDWTLIEQIRLRGPEVGSCPICLHPPIAAKMTRCGHIYCWPCVLHYLALSDRAWRGCPVCADPIYRKDLKSVISIPQCQYKIGEQIEFRLMCREKDSLMPHFVSQPPAEELGHMSNERGQKLVLATPQEVAEFILRREKVELETQYECEKDEPEACFILEALTLLRDRENQQASSYEDVDSSAEISLQDIGKLEFDDSLLAEEQELDGLNDRMRTSVSSDPSGDLSKDEISGTGTVSSIGPEDLEFHETEVPKSNEPGTSTTPKRDVHYFYQAVDGQNIYLHGVNAQMLIHEYGSLEKAPRILHGKIIERDTITMTHELKNRLRYLRHLPVTTVFEVIEIDLCVPVISKATFDRFRDRLAEREHRRRRKDREEKRRERRIQVEEEAKLGRYPKLNVKLDSSLHFPSYSRDEYQPEDEPGPSLAPECHSEIEVSPAQEFVWGGASSSSGPSFAQTLREGKLKPSPSWPVVKGVRSVTTSQPRSKAWESEDEEPFGFGIEYQPPEAMSLSAALSAALDKAVQESSKGPAESSSTSRKKKNKSKKLLFSTGF